MNRQFTLLPVLALYGVVVPVALLLGYVVADPASLSAAAVLGGVGTILCLPMILKWHHELVIVSWNAALSVFFLPGQPPLWMFSTAVSLLILVLNQTMGREAPPRWNWSVGLPLLVIAGITLMTAYVRGGVGMRVLGSESFGGKKYVYILAAVAGFFALSARTVPRDRRRLLGGLFFLTVATSALSNLVFLMGRESFWLYYLFPPEYSMHLFAEEAPGSLGGLRRYGAVGFSCIGLIVWMFARYGLGGILSLRSWWRLLVVLGVFAGSLFGGFRSTLLILGVLLVMLVLLDRTSRAKLVLGSLTVALLVGAFLAAFSNRLPLSLQRTICFLPFRVDAGVRYDAEVSTQWRLDMWRVVAKDVPVYLWIGKGFKQTPSEVYLVGEAVRRGLASQYEASLAAGDYHSGIFTLLVSFGVPGLAVFVWFCIAGLRLLWRNYRASPPDLVNLNTLLLALFATRLILYFAVYGAFSADLFQHTGIVGLSIALNGTSPEAAAEAADAAAEEPALARAGAV
jgi:hypothetical protein